jgi:hypothetical protein
MLELRYGFHADYVHMALVAVAEKQQGREHQQTERWRGALAQKKSLREPVSASAPQWEVPQQQAPSLPLSLRLQSSLVVHSLVHSNQYTSPIAISIPSDRVASRVAASTADGLEHGSKRPRAVVYPPQLLLRLLYC